MEVDFLNHTEPKTLDDLRDYEKLYFTIGILIIQLRNYNCIFIFHSTHTLHLLLFTTLLKNGHYGMGV